MSRPWKRISPRGGLEQAHQQARGGALAAAGLPHQPERLAAAQLEADPGDGLDGVDLALEHHAARDREALDEVAHLQQRLVPRCSGSTVSRSPGAQASGQRVASSCV